MKKTIFICGVLFMLAIASCNQKEPTYTSPEKTTVPADTQQDGTTIKASEKGVSVESKEGGKKTNVNISKDSAGIEIKRPK